MTRRSFLASLPAAAVPITAMTATPMQAAARRPNILVLLADDQRWDTLGCMGNRIIRTPVLDALAARGTLFRNNYVTTSICMCSRASILTGQYTRTHGVKDFARNLTPEQHAATYPQLLRQAGYRTGFIGKYGVGDTMPASSFDYWKGFGGQGKFFPKGEPGPHLTAIMGDQALAFFGEAAKGPEQPWCLSVSFKAPHAEDPDPRQYLPEPAHKEWYKDETIPPPRQSDPKYFAAMPERARTGESFKRWKIRFDTPEKYQEYTKNYYRLITEIDLQVGRMVEALRASGQLENTLIVYTSDNGYYLAERGLADKWYMHEESIRTPLILVTPGQTQPLQVSEVSLNIDLAPTLLAAAGLKAPAMMQGQNLLPLARGARRKTRDEFFYEQPFDAKGGIPPVEGLWTKQWKYMVYYDEPGKPEELYNLQQDPGEDHNLAKEPKYAAQLEQMRARYQRWKQRLPARS